MKVIALAKEPRGFPKGFSGLYKPNGRENYMASRTAMATAATMLREFADGLDKLIHMDSFGRRAYALALEKKDPDLLDLAKRFSLSTPGRFKADTFHNYLMEHTKFQPETSDDPDTDH